MIVSGQTSINQAVRTGESLPADAEKAKIVGLADRWSTWIVVIALTAADVALVDNEIKELPHLIALSRHMMTVIKINMTFSMALNFLAIVPAIIGTPNPVVGALDPQCGFRAGDYKFGIPLNMAQAPQRPAVFAE